MSTSPLTLVVGEIRMPRLRPLELVSRSLGREWSLLPPNVSFRTELKALYAAMLRTFCLSADAIRTMCRWDPDSLRKPSATMATLAPAATPSPIPLGMRHPTRTPARESRQWNTLAGGACAIGGVAAIAWLMANHPRQPASPTLADAPEVTLNAAANHDGNVHSRSGNIERPADAPVAWNRTRGDLTARKPDESTTIDTSGSDAGHVFSTRTGPATTHASASPATGHETPATQASRITTERASPIARALPMSMQASRQRARSRPGSIMLRETYAKLTRRSASAMSLPVRARVACHMRRPARRTSRRVTTCMHRRKHGFRRDIARVTCLLSRATIRRSRRRRA